MRALDRLGPGAERRALDLASGSGRHTLELARRGWRAEAWDVSPVALANVSARAAEEGLPVVAREIDLAGGLCAARGSGCELALVVDFLDRALLAGLGELVLPDGHAIVSTFTVDRPGTHPRREWCLERGELARGLEGFEVVHAEEARGRASLLARRRGKSEDEAR